MKQALRGSGHGAKVLGGISSVQIGRGAGGKERQPAAGFNRPPPDTHIPRENNS